MRLPMALSPGQNWRAMVSLTIVGIGSRVRSAASKARPSTRPNPERVEILRADEVDVARGLGAAARHGPAVDDEPLAGGEAVERQVAGQRHALDAGQRGEAGLQPLMEGATGVVRLVGGRQRQRARQQLLRAPAVVAHGEAIDAADEEAGGRQQDERERHLGDDQAVPQAMVGPRRRAAAALLQRLVDVAPRRQPAPAGCRTGRRSSTDAPAVKASTVRSSGIARPICPAISTREPRASVVQRGHQQAEAAAGEPEQHALDRATGGSRGAATPRARRAGRSRGPGRRCARAAGWPGWRTR